MIIGNDDYDNDDYDDDDVPDRVAADNDDHNVDAHSGDQNLALSDQFLQYRLDFESEVYILDLLEDLL